MASLSGPELADRRFVFLISSSRTGGNAETLARRAAMSLPKDIPQTWLRLADLPLPPFEDIRHSGGAYSAPRGHGQTLLDATLEATDLVIVAPLYWYSLPASAKLYLDHWSGWMRVPGLDFKLRMAGRTMWAISMISDENAAVVTPLLDTLKLTADYLDMAWGGSLVGFGNRPDDVLGDTRALERAARLFDPEGPTKTEAGASHA